MRQAGKCWRPEALPLALAACLMVVLFAWAPGTASAIPTLTNDEGLHLVPGDSLFPHFRYDEQLKRNKIERDLLEETREKPPKEIEELIGQEIPGGARTSFLSNSHHLVALPFVGNAFSYFHQVPPEADPDVSGSPEFDDFDFTQNLIEVEIPQTPIPEPGTLLLLGSGVLGAAAYRWRRGGQGKDDTARR